MNNGVLFYEKPVDLRQYQVEAVEKTMDALSAGKNPLLVMPTGTGKTECFARMCELIQGGVLVLAHREELIEHARVKIRNRTREDPGIERAEFKSNGERVIIASVQSLKNRLEKFGSDHFKTMIIDEAHHAPAPTYLRIIEKYNCPVMGCTATPERADEKSLKRIFDHVSFQYELADAMLDGWLVEFIGRTPESISIDLSSVRRIAGDLSESDLEKIVLNCIDPLVGAVQDELSDRKTIAFMPGVASAHLFNEALINAGFKSAVIVGNTENRGRILSDLTEGKIRIVVTCMVLTEGFDEPSLDGMLMARPTNSRTLLMQMIGRGLRPNPPRKQNLKLVEMTDNSKKHNLADPFEIFASKGISDAVRKIARNLKGDNYLGLIMKAREIIESKITEARLPGKYASFNPFIFGEIEKIGLDGDLELSWKEESIRMKPSEPQIKFLKAAWFNKDFIASLNRGQASLIIGRIKDVIGDGPLWGYAKIWHEEKMRELMG